MQQVPENCNSTEMMLFWFPAFHIRFRFFRANIISNLNLFLITAVCFSGSPIPMEKSTDSGSVRESTPK